LNLPPTPASPRHVGAATTRTNQKLILNHHHGAHEFTDLFKTQQIVTIANAKDSDQNIIVHASGLYPFN
jgi:hypothetical protein